MLHFPEPSFAYAELIPLRLLATTEVEVENIAMQACFNPQSKSQNREWV